MRTIIEQIDSFYKKTPLKFRLRMWYYATFKPIARLKKMYKNRMGVELNIDAPITFNEKLQWLKVKHFDELWVKCANKATLREYLRERNMERLVLPCIGIYKKPSEIPFSELPERFVIKVANSSGFNLFITSNEDKKHEKAIKKCLKKMQREKYYRYYFEWVYRSYPWLIIEEYIDNREETFDCKFLCIDGKTVMVQFLNSNKEIVTNANFTRELKKMNCSYSWDDTEEEIEHPVFYEDMLRDAEEIAKEFPVVRVDFLVSKNRYYVSEMTFFPGSGYDQFKPDSYDYKFGEMLKIGN